MVRLLPSSLMPAVSTDRNYWEYDVMWTRLNSDSAAAQIRLNTWSAASLLSWHYSCITSSGISRFHATTGKKRQFKRPRLFSASVASGSTDKNQFIAQRKYTIQHPNKKLMHPVDVRTNSTSTVLPEKPTDPQLLNKIPAFYGTLRFITSSITVRHLSLSWITSIQAMSSFHFCKIHFNIILYSTPRSSK